MKTDQTTCGFTVISPINYIEILIHFINNKSSISNQHFLGRKIIEIS